jgi:hypothetical protein
VLEIFFHICYLITLTWAGLGTSTPSRISTKQKIKTPKEAKPPISKYKGTSQGPKLVHAKLASLRRDDTGLSTVKSPSESSSSAEESSSEEESEYEEDEELPVKDISQVSF